MVSKVMNSVSAREEEEEEEEEMEGHKSSNGVFL